MHECLTRPSFPQWPHPFPRHDGRIACLNSSTIDVYLFSLFPLKKGKRKKRKGKRKKKQASIFAGRTGGIILLLSLGQKGVWGRRLHTQMTPHRSAITHPLLPPSPPTSFPPQGDKTYIPTILVTIAHHPPSSSLDGSSLFTHHPHITKTRAMEMEWFACIYM